MPDYRAVCNGALVAHTSRSSRETWTYEQAEPMATYLATVQIGRYELLELDAGPPRRPGRRSSSPFPGGARRPGAARAWPASRT